MLSIQTMRGLPHLRAPGIVSCIIMVALCNRADHYIFALWFLSSSSSSSFSSPNLSGRIGCLPYFHTWCGLSANLRRRSETCCTRLAGNSGRKNVAKNRHLPTIAQLCRAISFLYASIVKSNFGNCGGLNPFLYPLAYAPRVCSDSDDNFRMEWPLTYLPWWFILTFSRSLS